MNGAPKDWLLLILTLPTENATPRMRFWRALKSMGCAVLRDGVYLLPYSATHEAALEELAAAIVEAEGTATLIETDARDADQAAMFRNLFDRADDYAAFAKSLREARKSLSGLSTSEVGRLLRRLRREYEALRATDFFPSEATVRAEAAWTDFVGSVDTVLSPDEPHATDGMIKRLDRKDYQGRTWATRRHLWIDRVASAWLIRRFIDPKARFIWLEKPAACPKKALGFDFDGATFTHVGERVTFEVLVASFGLESDAALVRLGELVRALDVGGAVIPEAAGLEALMAGARQRAADDDALLAEMSGALDSLYAFYTGSAPKNQRR
ncbi:MAG: chromate resistance protein [Sinobacteraceae bacterium]|nr:chromate resistance protein [Nevskiaceae bacterium]